MQEGINIQYRPLKVLLFYTLISRNPREPTLRNLKYRYCNDTVTLQKIKKKFFQFIRLFLWKLIICDHVILF
jgi:hypothetical protein